MKTVEWNQKRIRYKAEKKEISKKYIVIKI